MAIIIGNLCFFIRFWYDTQNNLSEIRLAESQLEDYASDRYIKIYLQAMDKVLENWKDEDKKTTLINADYDISTNWSWLILSFTSVIEALLSRCHSNSVFYRIFFIRYATSQHMTCDNNPFHCRY